MKDIKITIPSPAFGAKTIKETFVQKYDFFVCIDYKDCSLSFNVKGKEIIIRNLEEHTAERFLEVKTDKFQFKGKYRSNVNNKLSKLFYGASELFNDIVKRNLEEDNGYVYFKDKFKTEIKKLINEILTYYKEEEDEKFEC